jgi:hypothetical protein
MAFFRLSGWEGLLQVRRLCFRRELAKRADLEQVEIPVPAMDRAAGENRCTSLTAGVLPPGMQASDEERYVLYLLSNALYERCSTKVLPSDWRTPAR